MKNIEQEFRQANGFEWPEGAGGYQPSEIGPGEVHEELKKAGYVGAAHPAASFELSDIFAVAPGDQMEGFHGCGSFLPPGARDEVSESVARLRRQSDGTGSEPRRAQAGRYEAPDPGDNPQLKVIRTERGERIEVIRP